MDGMLSQLDITERQSRAIVERAKVVSGIQIDADKTDFIRLRLSKRVRELGMLGFDEYITRLKADASGAEMRYVVEALATHTTSFFREKHQYDWFEKEGLAMLAQDGGGLDRPLVLWSAASSTGVELWSAGMLLAEAALKSSAHSKFQLIGTDISRKILVKAKSATYTQDEITGIDAGRRSRFLMKSKQNLDQRCRPLYRIVPELRQKAAFEYCNLQEVPALRPFQADLVFLRNVLIYFDHEAQQSVLDSVIERLRPGGVLLTGHAEAVAKRSTLRSIGPSTYQKV
ncbi:MAG: chemotaxis protein methyltransferase CheR [Paracoccaceae bacterium]|jgi:chemotaxis protein methyltransferase CheR